MSCNSSMIMQSIFYHCLENQLTRLKNDNHCLENQLTRLKNDNHCLENQLSRLKNDKLIRSQVAGNTDQTSAKP